MGTLKLLLRIRCTVCRGSRVYSAGGYHDPLNPTKWKSCPYCDEQGATYIEASVNVIVEYLASLPVERRNLILQRLDAEISEEIK